MLIDGIVTAIDLEGTSPNTLIEYAYRDADNYKISGIAVLEGRLSPDQAEAIVRSLDEGRFFIPGQVGLRDLQGDFSRGSSWSEADHVWHSLNRLSYTEEAPTAGHDTRDVDSLVDEWPSQDGWDPNGHAATLSTSTSPAIRP